jgi:hypothetical protein
MEEYLRVESGAELMAKIRRRRPEPTRRGKRDPERSGTLVANFHPQALALRLTAVPAETRMNNDHGPRASPDLDEPPEFHLSLRNSDGGVKFAGVARTRARRRISVHGGPDVS